MDAASLTAGAMQGFGFSRRDSRKFARMLARAERRERRRKKPRVRALTERQRNFIDAFCSEALGNATQAARIAGYRWPSKVGPALIYHPLVNPVLHARIGLISVCARGPFRSGLMTFNGESYGDSEGPVERSA